MSPLATTPYQMYQRTGDLTTAASVSVLPVSLRGLQNTFVAHVVLTQPMKGSVVCCTRSFGGLSTNLGYGEMGNRRICVPIKCLIV